MGCFLACFGGPNDRRRRRRSPKRTLPVTPSHELYKAQRPNPSLAQLALDHDSTKKVVSDNEVGTGDKDIGTSLPEIRDHDSKELITDKEISKGDKEIATSLPDIRENPEKGSPTSYKKKVTFDLKVTTYEDPKHCIDEASDVNTIEEKELKPVEDQCSSKSSPSFPVNHRYQNCEMSDEDVSELDDDEEEDFEDCDSDEEAEDDEAGLIGANEEESYDSYFSLPIDKEQPSLQEANSPNPKCSSSPERLQQPIAATKSNARDRSQYVHSVLNPVENLSQWKEVKVRATPGKNPPRKENISVVEPVSGVKKPQMSTDTKQVPSVPAKQEISVDASLSNWLVSSENSTVEGPQESYSRQSSSPISREERPILGALTVEDMKQSSVTSSPRRSPSKSPDDMPILGTVGTHWNCRSRGIDSASSNNSGSEFKGIPNTTSKYREDKRVNWHSTPFEVRLERALNQGAP